MKDELKHLTDACGHHCGFKDRKEGHCPCPECHGRVSPDDVAD